jgi:hypothetical protein
MGRCYEVILSAKGRLNITLNDYILKSEEKGGE